MRAVNLLPPERRNPPSTSPLAPVVRRPLFVAVGLVVVVVAVVLGVETHSASSSVGNKQRQLAQVQNQIAATRTVKRALSASALASASSRRATIVSLAQRRLRWDAFLGSVSRVMPEDVWLVALTASPSGSAAAPSSASSTSTASSSVTTSATPFAISGYTYSQSSVARLMDRLALIPWLSDVQLQGDSLAPLGSRNVFQFSIGASMANTGGAS
jgi:Tfp pilus assembly protein PilN